MSPADVIRTDPPAATRSDRAAWRVFVALALAFLFVLSALAFWATRGA